MPRIKDKPSVLEISSNTALSGKLVVEKILVTTGSGANVVVTLPDPSVNNGIELEILKVDSGTKFVEIAPNGAENIRGSNASIYAIQQFESIKLYCDGTDWILLGDPYRTISAEIDDDASIIRQDGTWTSVAHTGTGIYTFTVISGIFLDIPNCVASVHDSVTYQAHAYSTSATETVVRIANNSATLIDSGFQIIAVGKK